jgi:predicted dehydrogenase
MELNLYPTLPRKKDFRIGILGSGFIVSECHLVAYRKAGFNPVAIASRNRDHAVKTALLHEIPQVHDSYDALLDDRTIEVLDIAVPPNALLGLIQKACERKTVKGILAQKPLGMNYAEAVEAVAACEKAGITLAVNQNMRYDHSVRAAKTLLENGTIGEPVIATIDMRAIPHWQPWQAELGWLTLRIMSIHHLDTFRYLFGEPDRIYCSTRPDPRTKFAHKDGICSYILEFANGLRCIAIDDIWTGPAREGCAADLGIKWRIEGLNGLAIGSIGWCHDPYTTPSTIQYASKGDHGFQSPVWPESWFPEAFIGTMADLLCALENGTEPSISGRDNLKTMALVEAAYFSAESHKAFSPRQILVDYHRIARVDPGQTAASKWSRFLAFLNDSETQTSSQWSKLTPRAQKVLASAHREARRLNHNFVDTEHVLLGLLELGGGVAWNVLISKGLPLELVRSTVEKLVGVGVGPRAVGNLPYSPRVKKVLHLAAKEANALQHTYVGTEHILLGLLSEGEGFAARVFENFGLETEETRREIIKELDPNRSQG